MADILHEEIFSSLNFRVQSCPRVVQIQFSHFLEGPGKTHFSTPTVMGIYVLAVIGVWVAVDVGVLGEGVVNEQVCVTVGCTCTIVGGDCWGVMHREKLKNDPR